MTLAAVAIWVGRTNQKLPWFVWLGMALDAAVIVSRQFITV